MRISKLLITVVTVLSVSACSKNDNSDSHETESVKSDSMVIARVDGIEVTEEQLEWKLQSMLGDFQMSLLDQEARNKALDSLLVSRIMAKRSAQNLDGENMQEIVRKVDNYRETLLVNEYIKAHADIQPVSEEMVKDYYESHPEKFGGKTLRMYEMLVYPAKLAANEKQSVIKDLSAAQKVGKWEQYAKKLKSKGTNFKYLRGQMDDAIMKPQLKVLAASLKVGQVSEVTLVEGWPYLVKVVSEEKIAPQPLAEVSGQIRQSLAPIQLKKAVAGLSQEILSKEKIEYVKK